MGRYEYHQAEVDLSSSTDLPIRLEAFKRRAADLISFIDKQQLGIQSIHIDRSDKNNPKVQGSIPNELVLEALYRRFRFFILNDEKANYHRFLRLLSSSSRNELLHLFTRLERKEFFRSDILQLAFVSADAKYRPEEVIDFWFNAYYFHDQEPERNKLTAFENTVTSDGAKILLWNIVWNSTLKIRNLAYLLHETSPENSVVNIPCFAAFYSVSA